MRDLFSCWYTWYTCALLTSGLILRFCLLRTLVDVSSLKFQYGASTKYPPHPKCLGSIHRWSSGNILQCICLLVGKFPFLDSLQPRGSPAQQKSAAEGLISRYLPTRAEEFTVEIDQSLGQLNKDSYQVKLLLHDSLKS